MIKKLITAGFVSLLFFNITGCSSMPEAVTGVKNYHYGYRHYDPCIRCGESWVTTPNQNMAAIRESRKTPGFTDADYELARQKILAQSKRK